MQKFNLISALMGAMLTLIIGETVKWFKEKRRRHKRRAVLSNYLSKVIKPGLIKYGKDLDAAINEISNYPPPTNIIAKHTYDVLPWLNSKILSSQDLDELYELTQDGELHADVVMLGNVIDYLKDYAPHLAVQNFNQACNDHYEKKDVKSVAYYSHAKSCGVIQSLIQISTGNLKGRKNALESSIECVEIILSRLKVLQKRNWFFFYKVRDTIGNNNQI